MQIHRSTRRSPFVLSVTAIAAVLSATSCSGGDTTAGTADETPASVETATPPVVSTSITEGSGTFGSARSVACDIDHQTISVALDAFVAINGDGAVLEPDLVSAGLLREESGLYDIADGNAVVPSPAGGCTS